MDRASCLTRSKSDSAAHLLSYNQDGLLPLPAQSKPTIRVRAVLSHCLYRRVILWTVAAIALFCLVLSSGRFEAQHDMLMEYVLGRPPKADGKEAAKAPEDKDKDNDDSKLPSWLQYQHLDAYFIGIRALVPFSQHTPEYPPDPSRAPAAITVTLKTEIPTPTPYVPQPDYQSAEYTDKYHPVQQCYLDRENKVPVPDVYAYDGLPQGLAKPVIGSYDLLGLREDVCFERWGRYGPYGLGYDAGEGGTGVGLETEHRGSELVWARTGKIDYRGVDWGDAQERCYEANSRRFIDAGDKEDGDEQRERGGGAAARAALPAGRRRLQRTAVVIRTYVGFKWTQLAVLNFRAMVSELALRSGGEYDVHLLLHVKDEGLPIWSDPETVQRILDDNVPREFHGLCTLWSVAQMRLLYPGRFGDAFENPSGRDVHGVYRSAHMPLQHFAVSHPQYAHFWNWEMDMRYVGNYYELFDRLGRWAAAQPRAQAWERSEKYYIPALHGSWANFTGLVAAEAATSGRPPVLGPVVFPGRQPLRAEERGRSFLPDTCRRGADAAARCGVGEEADLVALNPLFDTDESGWFFQRDVTGYDTGLPAPPRRCAIVTASRLSRRLLLAMHEETFRLHHAMFSEMFPPSVALHRGLKALYAPHPVYLDRRWDLGHADAAFNGGRGRTTSGAGSPFDKRNEHNFKGASWYYNSEFAGLLWRRWLGYAQRDGRGDGGGRAGEGALRGGPAEEGGAAGSGRLCLRSMLVHPIKFENPADR